MWASTELGAPFLRTGVLTVRIASVSSERCVLFSGPIYRDYGPASSMAHETA